GRGAGPAGRRPVYLHPGGAAWAVRPIPPHRQRHDRLPGQLPADLRPPELPADPAARPHHAAPRRGRRAMATPPTRLILASGSPARRDLMSRMGVPFEVIPAAVEEPLQAGTGDARSYVAEIAWIKAAAVAPRVDRGIVIAADTVGWLDGGPVLKPDDEADAR